jgi:hypothetical protein
MQDKLLDGPVVSWARIERDSWLQTRLMKTRHMCCLIHHILAREIVAAQIQNMGEGIGPSISGKVGD